LGRTISSFRIALAEEESEWRKEYRKYLSKRERKAFDEMFALVRPYVSPCSNAVNPIRIRVIIVTILFHHFLDLMYIAEDLGLNIDSGGDGAASQRVKNDA
jgi:hypothetical protein